MTIIAVSAGMSAIFFLAACLPPLLRKHWIRHDCIITTSEIIPEYCCEKTCNTCLESYPYVPTCNRLIDDVHKTKNLTRCLAGDRQWCIDDVNHCDDGYHCCDTRWSKSQDRPVCVRQVHHRACQVNCATCYSSIVAYTYTANDRNYSVRSTMYHEKDRRAAMQRLDDEYLGLQVACWSDPERPHSIKFTAGVPLWAITLCSILIAPLIIAIVLWIGRMISNVMWWRRQTAAPSHSYTEESRLWNDTPPKYTPYV